MSMNEATVKGPTRTTTTPCPSFADYLENPESLSIASQWEAHIQHQQKSHRATTVFSLAWMDNDTTLAGCTLDGQILVWKIPANRPEVDFGDINEDDDNEQVYDPQPSSAFSMPGAAGDYTLYAMKLIHHDSKRLLLVAGDGGVFVFDWDEQMAPHLPKDPSAPGRRSTPVIIPLTPRHHFPTHPSPYQTSTTLPTECNDICYNESLVYAAAGDAFGGYCWNLETQQLVTTYRAAGLDQLYTVSHNNNMLLLAGDGPTIHLYDVRAKNKSIASITPPSSPPYHLCSSLAVDDWAMVGGGATIHIPTQRVVYEWNTKDTVHCMHVTNTSIQTGHASGVVTEWQSRPIVRATNTRWAVQDSTVYAVAANQTSVMAVGGESVHVFYDTRVPLCQLMVPPKQVATVSSSQ